MGERAASRETGATRSPDLTDENLDADIARMVAVRRNRKSVGYGFAPARHARPVERPQHVIRRRTGVHDFTQAYLDAECELLERLLSAALARLDRRDRQVAKAERRRQRRRQIVWMAGTDSSLLQECDGAR